MEINKDLFKLTKSELLLKCKEHGIIKYFSKNKLELILLINKEEKLKQEKEEKEAKEEAKEELKEELKEEEKKEAKEEEKLKKIFNLERYFDMIDKIIINILSRKISEKLTYDIMDTEKLKINKKIVLKEKQRQMKVGEIMQIILGNYDKFINLGNGHESGLDIVSHERKIIIELKNRTNTDNASSKKSNFDKLAKFKMNNPEYSCIYGCINDETEEKTNNGKIEIIKHNNIELKIYVGHKLLELILGDDKDKIINHVKNLIDKLT